MQAVDQNENSYQLTQNDKLRILDQLFLRQKQVKYQEIAELLNLKSFGTRRKSGLQKFRSGYTLYHQIRAILPSYQLETIDELFKKTEKIERLEELILNINLFDEEASKL